jgi:hypothetical protein
MGERDREKTQTSDMRHQHTCTPESESGHAEILGEWSGQGMRAMSDESGHSIVPGQHFRSSGKMNEWTDGLTGRKDGCRQQAGRPAAGYLHASYGPTHVYPLVHMFVHRPSASR